LRIRLNGLVLSKDVIRADLFSHEAIDFSREQDDLCMNVIFLLARYLLTMNPERTIIIDGRTFSRSYQIDQLLTQAAFLKVTPVIIECICDDATAKQRINSDQRTGAHQAGNRTYRLYSELKIKAEPIIADHLRIDTGKDPLERLIDRCLTYLNNERVNPSLNDQRPAE
jgi:hypothetical protein